MKTLFDAGDQLKLDLEVIVNFKNKVSVDVEELKYSINLFIKRYLNDTALNDFYEPNDFEEGDIGSATVAEMRRQNGEL